MRKQPLHFRKEEVSFVTKRWQASESCSLVGVGSVGKTNLIHHLSDPDVHAHYLGEQSQTFRTIMIDPNLLGPIDRSADEQFRCWAGYELMMHRLYMAFYPFEVLGDDANYFFETYQNLQDGNNPLYAYMGLRYFELGLEFFLRRGIQIVFMFDEFEELVRKMPPKFFQTLRGLRDNYKSYLFYLAFSREPFPEIVKKAKMPEPEMEPFIELFTDNVCYVGPYNSTDAYAMVDNLVRRNQRPHYPPHVIDFLIYASGRYAGILRAGFRVLDNIGNITPENMNSTELLERFASRSPIRAECVTIWNSLTAVEQRVLKTTARLNTFEVNSEAERAVPLLMQKRLLHLDRDRQLLQIEPPVLRAFVESDPEIVE